MIRYLTFCMVALVIIGTTPLVQGRTSEPQDEMETVVGGNSEFAFNLYARIKDDPKIKEGGGNLFFSPDCFGDDVGRCQGRDGKTDGRGAAFYVATGSVA